MGIVAVMNEKLWYLKKCPLFGQLTHEEVSAIEPECQSREFARGELIYRPGDLSDSVLLLARGRVRIFHVTPEGKQAILTFVDPNEVFSELSAFEGAKRDEFAEAHDDSLVVMVPRTVITGLLKQHTTMASGWNRLLQTRLRRVERRVKSLLFRSSRDRVIHLLLELAEKYGQSSLSGVLINVRMSHGDMASVIGSTRETVTIVLGELQAEGLVEVEHRRMTLPNVELLRRLIDFGPFLHLPVQSTTR